jgi:hypothetical protein
MVQVEQPNNRLLRRDAPLSCAIEWLSETEASAFGARKLSNASTLKSRAAQLWVRQAKALALWSTCRARSSCAGSTQGC